MAPSPRLQHGVNKWAARIIPAILIGLIGFATWVVVVLIGVNYLIHPPGQLQARRGAGIAIIVIYVVLFLFMVIAFLRLLTVVLFNPGLVPLPSEARKTRGYRRRRKSSHGKSEKTGEVASGHRGGSSQQVDFLDRGAIYGGRETAPNGLEQYYERDIFECEMDGMPRWCSTCKTWKPDRSHHSSEIGRCVYKMDHFCPWAGGIISETTYKFFVQFCSYTVLYCAFTLIVTAYFTAEWHRLTSRFHVTWVIIIALAGLFFLFTFGMTYNSLLAVFKNTTTVDSLTRQNRVYHFAILLPDWHPLVQYEVSRRTGAQPSTAMSQPPPPAAITPYATITYPLPDPSKQASTKPLQQPRVFAILPSPQGSNPAHGLPTHDADNSTSDKLMYDLGPVIEKMKKDAGLISQGEKSLETDRHGRRRIKETDS